jgi:hypothetical protein
MYVGGCVRWGLVTLGGVYDGMLLGATYDTVNM